MVYVVARPKGRFEIRETRRTAAGPRATTLATFPVFNDDVLELVRARAVRPFDAEQLRDRARTLGAPVEEGREDHLARRLVAAMSNGRSPSPGLRRVLADALAGTEMPPAGSLGDVALWIGVTDEARGEALADLLGLADALPQSRRPGELAFPHLCSVHPDD